MNKIETVIRWAPDVLARSRLDERRWAYLIDAPFDTPPHIPDLLGLTVELDGHPFEICGTLPKVPQGPIRKGELLGLLVRDLAENSPPAGRVSSPDEVCSE
jgi:hypothetical protein